MPPVKSKGPKIAALLRLLATLFANSFPRHFGHLFTLVISQLSKDIYRGLFHSSQWQVVLIHPDQLLIAYKARD